jgi:hypothetical protein
MLVAILVGLSEAAVQVEPLIAAAGIGASRSASAPSRW